MTEALPNFEGLLREALAPVEPPADLVERLEHALTSITEHAVDELEAWELSAMRDPRNWVRPATALVVGGAAGAALVLLRARTLKGAPRGAHPLRGHTQKGIPRGAQAGGQAGRRAHGSPAGLDGVREAAERALHDLEREARRLLGDR